LRSSIVETLLLIVETLLLIVETLLLVVEVHTKSNVPLLLIVVVIILETYVHLQPLVAVVHIGVELVVAPAYVDLHPWRKVWLLRSEVRLLRSEVRLLRSKVWLLRSKIRLRGNIHVHVHIGWWHEIWNIHIDVDRRGNIFGIHSIGIESKCLNFEDLGIPVRWSCNYSVIHRWRRDNSNWYSHLRNRRAAYASCKGSSHVECVFAIHQSAFS